MGGGRFYKEAAPPGLVAARDNVMGFLESVPAVAAKWKEPNPQERKFEAVVKDAEQAAVLVLVY